MSNVSNAQTIKTVDQNQNILSKQELNNTHNLQKSLLAAAKELYEQDKKKSKIKEDQIDAIVVEVIKRIKKQYPQTNSSSDNLVSAEQAKKNNSPCNCASFFETTTKNRDD